MLRITRVVLKRLKRPKSRRTYPKLKKLRSKLMPPLRQLLRRLRRRKKKKMSKRKSLRSSSLTTIKFKLYQEREHRVKPLSSTQNMTRSGRSNWDSKEIRRKQRSRI
jgi:hypothetical protein